MATNSFNFDAFNSIMKDANSGLRLFLALQQLQEVERVMRRYKSPLAREMADIVDELTDLREKNKQYLAKRENSTSGELDNATLPNGSMTQASATTDSGDNPSAPKIRVDRTIVEGDLAPKQDEVTTA
jgi:hypothetical protein